MPFYPPPEFFARLRPWHLDAPIRSTGVVSMSDVPAAPIPSIYSNDAFHCMECGQIENGIQSRIAYLRKAKLSTIQETKFVVDSIAQYVALCETAAIYRQNGWVASAEHLEVRMETIKATLPGWAQW